MKRTLILSGLTAVLATAGVAAWAQGGAHGAADGNAKHDHQTCTQSEGKSCPAEGKGAHQHGSGSMQGRMQGMHAAMGQNHARMAEMHAKMHGGVEPATPGGKEEEHKH